MNLDEIFRSDRYGPLVHLKVHRHYRYQSMWFLWQHLCNILSNFLHILISLEHYIVRAPRVGLPLHRGPLGFWSNLSVGSRDIACGVIYSTKYLIM